MSIISFINSSGMKFFLVLNIIVCSGTSYQLYRLPETLSETASRDTVYTCRNMIAPELSTLKDFIYFEGSVKSESFSLHGSYSYAPDSPSEMWDGYFTRVENEGGGDYLIWSPNKVYDAQYKNAEVHGWFVAIPRKFGVWKEEKKEQLFCNVLFPVMQKNFHVDNP